MSIADTSYAKCLLYDTTFLVPTLEGAFTHVKCHCGIMVLPKESAPGETVPTRVGMTINERRMVLYGLALILFPEPSTGACVGGMC